MHAQKFGAIGAILYNDPADYAPFGTSADQVYDQKWYMPPSGTQRGSTFMSNGDPLTPTYPSKGLIMSCSSRFIWYSIDLIYCRLYVQS
jgi:PA domain